MGFNSGSATAFANTGVTGNTISSVAVGASGALTRQNITEVGVQFNIASEYESDQSQSLDFGAAFAGTVAHEGAHILDEQFSGRNPQNFWESFVPEHNGYTVQSQVERQLGTKSPGFAVWNPSWLRAGDSEDLRREAVKQAAEDASARFAQ